jgi:hypothetical protein
MLGSECEIPLQAEIYNNKISYNLPFGETLQIPQRPAKAVASA